MRSVRRAIWTSAEPVSLSDRRYEAITSPLLEMVAAGTPKKGEKMAFVTLEDLDGTAEVVVFSDLYKKIVQLLAKDTAIYVKGRINMREDFPKVVASEILPLDQASQKLTRVLTIDLSTAGLDKETLKRLRDVLVAHKGNTPVYLTFKDPMGKRTILSSGESFKVNSNERLFDEVEAILGENAIHVRT